MSQNSSQIAIINKGKPTAPIYVYSSSGNETPMGTIRMYETFLTNFSDSSIASSFFVDKKGVDLLRFLLTTTKVNLYPVDSIVTREDLEKIKESFDIIKLYFSSITNGGRNKKIHDEYSAMIPNIKLKVKIITIKDTPIANILLEVIDSLKSSTRNTIKDVSQLIVSQGSIESARNKMIVSSTVGHNNLFLSPINPTAFDDFREFCRRYIGEGSKVSEDSGHNLEVLKTNLLMALGVFRHNLKMTDLKTGKEVELSMNRNSMANVNKVLIAFLQKPNYAEDFFKIADKLIRFYPDKTNDIEELKTIFVEGATFSPIIMRDENSYIGGSKERLSTIKRIISKIETIIPEEEPVKKSMWDDSSSDDEEIIIKKPVVKKSLKKKPIQITKIVSEQDQFKIDLKLIKTIMDLLNEAKDPFLTNESGVRSREIYRSIIDSTFGDVKSEFILDWWQQIFLDWLKINKSFILVGDTSGGKTFITIMGMIRLFTKLLNESDARFIYLGPSSQLVTLQFSNLLTYYPDWSMYFGICCKSIVNVPPTARILLGTPIEIKKYMYQIEFERDTVTTLDNIDFQIQRAIVNPFIKNCRTLFIDEIQTLSPTYVQTQEIEQTMECKAIEDIMKCVSYDKDKKSQIVGISATLSDPSIANLKQKISSISGIPFIDEIKYGHNDIGLQDEKFRESFIPIMKTPVVVPVLIDGQEIKTGTNEIIFQPLDNKAIEMIIRDAAYVRKVLPLSIYTNSELGTIQKYKDFIGYIERKNLNCHIWHSLAQRYRNNVDSLGFSEMGSSTQINKWLDLIKIDIHNLIYDANIDTVVHEGNFRSLIQDYISVSGDNIASQNIVLSPELYGLLYEYIAISKGAVGFATDIHPYYRFGKSNTDNFFSLITPGTNTDTIFKKLLIAQDADPNTNSGSIIPLIMRGIAFGIGIVTSSIPLAFQLEIFKFINVKGKQTDNFPIPIIFCEFMMTTGVNFSTMSVCILYDSLTEIGTSEFKQIAGRPGRRGNIKVATLNPVIYTYNVSNILTMNTLETLDFDLTNVNSSFFHPNEVYEYMCKLIVKFENNRDSILLKNVNVCETIISGDLFKGLGGSNVLLVRKIQLAKLQVSELFNTCKNMFPKIADDILRPFFIYLQRAEIYSLNVQIS